MYRSFILLVYACLTGSLAVAQSTVRWELNSLTTIGGNEVTLLGNPRLIDTRLGKAMEFDGIDDGVQLNVNPLKGASSFTVEVIFNPYSGGAEEQRFVHFEQDDNNRMLIELRSKTTDNWFLDTFIKAGTSSKTLYVETTPAPSNKWHHAALVYKDGVMTHYVNGREQTSGLVAYAPVTSGKTSLGVRLNKVSWYKGAIKTIKVSPNAQAQTSFISSEVDSLNIVTGSFKREGATNGFTVEYLSDRELCVKILLTSSQNAGVHLYNTNGVQVLTLPSKLYTAGMQTIQLPVYGLKPGHYIVQLAIDGAMQSKSIVIE